MTVTRNATARIAAVAPIRQVLCAAAGLVIHAHESIRILERRRPQKYAVDERKCD
jgi:hypothetical protein